MDDHLEFIRRLVEAFVGRAREELDHRLEMWPCNLDDQEFHEVAGALLARQVVLATQFAACPPIWNGHVAPIVLRAMADVYITLAWILQDPKTRSIKFIHYGLGQQKLQVERRRIDMDGREPFEGEEELIESIEKWIDSQRLRILVDVNLGSWSGISTRVMAEEAGCLNFYNYVYAPFSACAHSMWHHIAHYNLEECQNPLHRSHSVAVTRDDPPDIHYLQLAAKYLKKTCIQSAFDILNQQIEAVATRQSGSS